MFREFEEIAQEYQSHKIPYSVLLTAVEWRKKRSTIIARDRNLCQICKERCMDDWMLKRIGQRVIEVPGIYEEIETTVNYKDRFGEIEFSVPSMVIELVEQSYPRIPNVHHKYYITNRLPWEYPNEALILVCHICHAKIHRTESIKIYKSESCIMGEDMTPCDKCNGTGYLEEYQHWARGVCFKCKGVGFESL